MIILYSSVCEIFHKPISGGTVGVFNIYFRGCACWVGWSNLVIAERKLSE